MLENHIIYTADEAKLFNFIEQFVQSFDQKLKDTLLKKVFPGNKERSPTNFFQGALPSFSGHVHGIPIILKAGKNEMLKSTFIFYLIHIFMDLK